MHHFERQHAMDRRRRPEADGGIDIVHAEPAGARIWIPGSMQRRSPTFRWVTPAPTSMMVPAASWPSTIAH
ncbi:MAG: hypothetical protein JWP26_3552 [Devosia sp.]|nr:hypothetical protein [Devosia sp.]